MIKPSILSPLTFKIYNFTFGIYNSMFWFVHLVPEEYLQISFKSPDNLPPPESHVEGEVVKPALVETINVGGAVDHRSDASALEPGQVPGSLKLHAQINSLSQSVCRVPQF